MENELFVTVLRLHDSTDSCCFAYLVLRHFATAAWPLRRRYLVTSSSPLLHHFEFAAASSLPLVDTWWKIHNGWRDTCRKILSVWWDVTKWSVRLLLRREDRSRPSLGRNRVECDRGGLIPLSWGSLDGGIQTSYKWAVN
ncbi:Uncharacterized protein Fot_48496 [Forsythia ovata]|uniref:Uncharacterized protein n=1 Tax=Forsythia ovata TaxID=205694 RepID=A0ABD1Q966_9LAMI